MKKILYVVLGIVALWLLYSFIAPFFLPTREAGIAAQKASAAIEPDVLPPHISVPLKVRITLPDGLIRGETIATQLPNTFLTKDLSYSLTKTIVEAPGLLDQVWAGIGYLLTGKLDTRSLFSWDMVEVSSPTVPDADFELDIVSAQIDDITVKPGERHGQRVIATLYGEDIPAGGEIVMTYSTMSPWIISKAFAVRVDVNGVRLAEEPTFEVEPGQATSLQVIVPSSARPGEPFRVQLISRDRYENLANNPLSDLDLVVGDTVIEEDITFAGRTERSVTIEEPGVYRLKANNILSNPIRITENPQGPWWGDLHSHNAFSFDAHSSMKDPDHYTYARDVSGLDFTALTNHAFGLEENYWKITQDWCRDYNDPGRFVTILGYEGGFGYHLDGYFPGCDGPIIDDQRYGAGRNSEERVRAFEKTVDENNLIVAIHHTGIVWGGATFDGSEIFPRQLRHVEIFSAHGQSEFYAPDDPLSYENSRSTPVFSKSLDGPHYARDAWAAGMKLFTLAASDDHNGQPGKRANGLAAVFAPELERASLLKNFDAGNVYGTTGERVLLDFSVNGNGMGSVVDVPAGEQMTFSLEVHGTDELAKIRVYRYRFGAGDGWETVFERTGQLGLDFAESWQAPSVGKAVYYAAVEQANTIRVLQPVLADRPVRAWSSPIWNGAPVQAFPE